MTTVASVAAAMLQNQSCRRRRRGTPSAGWEMLWGREMLR
jgi:hypothetical protein